MSAPVALGDAARANVRPAAGDETQYECVSDDGGIVWRCAAGSKP